MIKLFIDWKALARDCAAAHSDEPICAHAEFRLEKRPALEAIVPVLERAKERQLLVGLLSFWEHLWRPCHVAHIDSHFVNIECGLFLIFAICSIVECLHRPLICLLLHEDGRCQLSCPRLFSQV